MNCSCFWDDLFKKPKAPRFKSDQDEIRQERSSRKYAWNDVSDFRFNVTYSGWRSRHFAQKVLPPGSKQKRMPRAAPPVKKMRIGQLSNVWTKVCLLVFLTHTVVQNFMISYGIDVFSWILKTASTEKWRQLVPGGVA